MLLIYLSIYMIFVAAYVLIPNIVSRDNALLKSFSFPKSFSNKWLSRFKHLPLLLLILPASLIFVKAFFALQSGNNIQAELVSPAKLTALGDKYLNGIYHDSSDSESYCISPDQCVGKKTLEGRTLSLVSAFHNDAKNPTLANNLIEYSNFSLYPEQVYRGLFLHHYSVVSTTYRLMTSGSWLAGFSSQYGLASVIPLFVLARTDFQLYGSVSFFIVAGVLLLIAIFGIRFRVNPNYALSIFFVMTLVGLCIDQGAIRISPGFSFYRYAPIIVMCMAVLAINRLSFPAVITLILPCALLNSIQFNILFLIIFFVSIAAEQLQRIFGERNVISKQYMYVLFTVSCVVLFQYILYLKCKGAFTPTLFGSVDEGATFHKEYASAFMLFPIVCCLSVALKRKKKISSSVCSVRIVSFDEIFALVCYGLLSTYCINFYNSPQHFVGFILMTTPACVLLLKRMLDKSLILFFIGFISISVPAIYLNYIKLPEYSKTLTNNFFETTDFGTALRYRSISNISLIATDYFKFIDENGAKTSDTYLLSKDKIYIEEASGKLLLPSSYDAYLNVRAVDRDNLFQEMKARGVTHIVIDSPNFVDELVTFLNFAGASNASEFEYKNYLAIIDHVEYLRGSNILKIRNCNDRYCIYDIN